MNNQCNASSPRRHSRRVAVTGSAAGLVALALGDQYEVASQYITPKASPGATPPAAGVSLLFVQSFSASELAPTGSDPDLFTLTLEQDSGQTLYFSDRPNRIVGIIDTATFVERFSAETAGDPANAALVAQVRESEDAIHVVELLDLHYDGTTNTATYTVRLLEDPGQIGLRFAMETLQSVDGARRYGPSQLFIDSGGLMQLVAYGAQDVYLTDPDPELE